MSFSRARPSADRVCHLLDRTGSTASVVCAIHCALMPFLLTVMPAALGESLSSEWVERALFLCSLAMGLTSMHFGRRIHRRSIAFVICAVGMTMLALGRIGEDRHWGVFAMPILVLGGLVVASAHFVNARLCRCCQACQSLVASNNEAGGNWESA